MAIHPHSVPSSGFRGLKENWRNDLISAFSVSLVALPLSLGIAIASGFPPISGIITAIIGGIVTTLYRGGHIAINGPAAGLIAVVFAAVNGLDDGSGRAVNYALAAIIVSGCLQTALGIFRLGKLANLFPSAVIHGMLAAIGVIIFSKQAHVALGTTSDAGSSIGVLFDIFKNIGNINPFVTIISLVCMLLLVYHARISYKLFHFLPAPMWVLVIAVPFVYWFNFPELHSIELLGKAFSVGPSLLIDIPDNLLDGIVYPDFSKTATPAFWLAVITITLISSIETLAIAKAIDKLDPYKRVTDSNKDLIGNGVSTIVAGCVGGLPIIPVIVRSSVNINNNGKTKWANFYHGLFLLLFVLLLSPLIQKVPLAALAAILVFTGFKLAAPRVFIHAYDQGIEQLLFLTGTLVITLFTDLLWGVFGGIAFTLLIQILLARVPLHTFFELIYKFSPQLQKRGESRFHLEVKGIANFLSVNKLEEQLQQVSPKTQLTIDLAQAQLVDLTYQEKIQDFKRRHEEQGGKVEVKGLKDHIASTDHPLALKSLQQHQSLRLTPRGQRFIELAETNNWQYRGEVDWDTSYLQNFRFFETRPIERKTNAIAGTYPKHHVQWEISDITFDEGAFLATEVYHTTVQTLQLPFEIPRFILEKEGVFDKIFDRVMEISGQRDIDFQLFTKFSRKFLLKGEDETAIRAFFTLPLIRFFEQEDIYHIESNGEALLLFQYLRLARTEETTRMVAFSERLIEKIKG